MVRMGSLGRERAAARAALMVATTVSGCVRIWRGVKCSTVTPWTAIRASRAAPGVTLVDVAMIGAAGRIYLGGPAAGVRRAQDEITAVLGAVTGREQ